MSKNKNHQPREVEDLKSGSVAGAPDELKKLQDELGSTKKELEEEKNKYLYLQADYQNFRRRSVKDVGDARMLGMTSALEPFLRVNDFLEMAKQAAEKSDNVGSLKQGLLMIIAEYKRALEELGVKKLKTVGEKFDPDFHDAVQQENSEAVPEGHVLGELSGGYTLGERLLRPARVVVSSGNGSSESETGENPGK